MSVFVCVRGHVCAGTCVCMSALKDINNYPCVTKHITKVLTFQLFYMAFAFIIMYRNCLNNKAHCKHLPLQGKQKCPNGLLTLLYGYKISF